MKRRRLLHLSASVPLAAAACGLALAQAMRRVRIGWLSVDPPTAEQWAMLVDGLHERGWSERQGNLGFVRRHSMGDDSRFPALARELVDARVDLIVAAGTQACFAAQAATRTTPIVFFFVGDALASGLVSDLARPTGNATGFGGFGAELHGKLVQLLKELLPRLARLAVLVNPDFGMHRPFLAKAEAAAKAVGVQPLLVPLRDAGGIAAAFALAARQRAEAVLLLTQPKIHDHAQAVARAALAQQLPTASGFESFARAGLLMGYGWRMEDDLKRVPDDVDRLLRGAAPGSLPVEMPSRFHLSLNLRTARALNIDVPPALRLRADEVIE